MSHFKNLAQPALVVGAALAVAAMAVFVPMTDTTSVAAAQLQASPGATQFFPQAPFRTLDTRTMTPYVGKKFPVQQPVDLKVVDYAKAVILNLTATNIDTPGFLVVWPCGAPMPNASNVNYSPAVNPAIANQATVAVTNGCFSIYSYGRTDVLVDVQGIFT